MFTVSSLEGAENGHSLPGSQSPSLGCHGEQLIGDDVMMMSFHLIQGTGVSPVLWLEVHITRKLEPPVHIQVGGRRGEGEGEGEERGEGGLKRE